MGLNLAEFDQIDSCISCGKPIKKIKLSYIREKMSNITTKELRFFKYCRDCKREEKFKEYDNLERMS